MSSPSVPSRHDGVRYLYMLAAFVVIVAGMRAAEQILNPLLLAVFASVICAPAYLGLLRRGMSQWLALLIVTGGLAIITVVLTSVVMGSISRFTSREAQTHYRDKILERKDEVSRLFQSWMPDAGESDDATDSDSDAVSESSEEASPAPIPEVSSDVEADGGKGESGEPSEAASDGMRPLMDHIYDLFNPGTVFSLATHLVRSLGSLLSNALLIMLTVVFILLEVGSFEGKLARAFPQRKDTTQQAEQMVHGVQRYMAIKTAVSIVTAILIGLWLRLFGVPYISLWLLLAFLLNFIPNIGSIIAAVPAVLIAWLDLGTMPAMGCAMGYIVVNVAIGNLLEPRLMGKDLGLSPLVIFCSMVFWGWVLGPVGMLLSVPLTMTVHIVLNGFDDTRWIATLMGDRAKQVQ